jgi:hypothetical protein
MAANRSAPRQATVPAVLIGLFTIVIGWEVMGRQTHGRRSTCESCLFIDVREWHRAGCLRAGLRFTWSWTRRGKALGSVDVRTEADAVILMLKPRGLEAMDRSQSSSACRSCGRCATLVARVLGSAATRLSAAAPAEGAWRSCTYGATSSRAASAAA